MFQDTSTKHLEGIPNLSLLFYNSLNIAKDNYRDDANRIFTALLGQDLLAFRLSISPT
jgi:hypothetical protein